jgi:exportin-2 (importin alpha re-exporter)
LLYSSKYKEDVQETIKDFCQEIWQLCSGASEDQEFDDIVFNCLKFFKSLMMWPDMRTFFERHILDLFSNLILPNIGVTSAQVGLFEEEVDLYIDYYFRNTEIQTRRAAALELLRVICRHYTSLFEPFLEEQIRTFENVAGNIKAECSLLGLIIDGSSKGFRDVDGCTQLFVK